MAVLPIGFFAPLPLPMMIPFMGIQSAVMAEQFGTMFQYGKRRISAMSNEEFNKMTPEMLQARITTQIQGMIPEMEKQIQAMRPMVVVIMKEFAEYVRLATEAIAKGGSEYLEHAAHGHIFGHGDTYQDPTTITPTPTETTLCPAGSHWDATRGTCVPDDTGGGGGDSTTTNISTTTSTKSPEQIELERLIDYYWDAVWKSQFRIDTDIKNGTDTHESYTISKNASLTSIYKHQEEYKTLMGHYYVTTKDQKPYTI